MTINVLNSVLLDSYHQPARFLKADKDLAKNHASKDIKFPFKIRDVHKTEKNSSIAISFFGYETKVKYPIYVSK